jgi:MGT family glycosyltransferase
MKRGRLLIATPGFTGHATPELTLARRLVRRGHDVSVYAPAELERQVAAAGAVHLPFAAFQLRRPSEAVPLAEQILQGARHFESPALAEELVDLLQRERVAVAVVDYLLAAAFTAAEAARVPTACVLPVLYTPWALWYGQHMYDDGAARAALGLHRSSGEAATALASWAKLVLVFSTRRFDFPIRGRRDRRVEYVGRMIDPELPRWDSPWPPDDRRPLVLVSPSSLYRRQRPAQLQQILDALGELPVRVLATLGLDADGDTVQAPANAVVRNWVPHEAALPGATLVVTNGGHNTVLAALAHGVPVLVSPLMREQEWNGRRAEAFGAGRLLAPNATSNEIRAALEELLSDPAVRRRSKRAARALRDRGGGGERAADHLERLLAP